MFPHREQVPAIARDKCIYLRLNCTSKNHVIGKIARHRLGWSLRLRNQLSREIDEKLLDPSPSLQLEAQLPGQDSLQLDHHRLG